MAGLSLLLFLYIPIINEKQSVSIKKYLLFGGFFFSNDEFSSWASLTTSLCSKFGLASISDSNFSFLLASGLVFPAGNECLVSDLTSLVTFLLEFLSFLGLRRSERGFFLRAVSLLSGELVPSDLTLFGGTSGSPPNREYSHCLFSISFEQDFSSGEMLWGVKLTVSACLRIFFWTCVRISTHNKCSFCSWYYFELKLCSCQSLITIHVPI